MSDATIKKTSFYEGEEKNMQEITNNNEEQNMQDTATVDNNKTEQKENTEKEQEQTTSPIIEELKNIIDTAKKNLSDSKKIQEEYQEIGAVLYSNITTFGIYYRTLSVFQANYQSFVEKYGEEEANTAALQLLNLMIESAVKTDYYFSMLMKNAIFNLNVSIIEIKERVNFVLNLLFEVMRDNFGIENPQEEYYRAYNEIIAG